MPVAADETAVLDIQLVAAVTVAFDDTRRVLDALAVHDPGAAERAGDALERLLGEIPEHAWTASELTGDGYPVEFTFTSRDRLIRCTVAPWPERGPQERLALAEALLGEPVPGWLRALAVDHELWIGARHGADGDRYKLYVPTPGADLGATPELSARTVEARMVSFEPATGVTERYFRVRRMQEPHLLELLRPVGLEHRAAELAAIVREAYGRPLDDGVPGPTAGFSVAARTAARPPSRSTCSRARCGAATARFRRELLDLARARGWDLGAYEQASAPLDGRDRYATPSLDGRLRRARRRADPGRHRPASAAVRSASGDSSRLDTVCPAGRASKMKERIVDYHGCLYEGSASVTELEDHELEALEAEARARSNGARFRVVTSVAARTSAPSRWPARSTSSSTTRAGRSPRTSSR